MPCGPWVASALAFLGRESGSWWGCLSPSLSAPNVDPVNWSLGSARSLAWGLQECLCDVVSGPGGEESVVPSKVFSLSFPRVSPLGGHPFSSLAQVCRFRWEPGKTRMELLCDFAKERGTEGGGWASESHITGCPPSCPRPGGTSPRPAAQDQLSIPGCVCGPR